MAAAHRHFMLRAIELALKARGKTYPNPLVGALVVKNGKIVGEGYHKKAGTAHAEVIAIKKAGLRARDADLYVSLEPCAHYGRTPPCAHNIKKSGIKKVFVAMKDPNPLVCGKGISILKKSGVEVRTGICSREARNLNPAYVKSMRKKTCSRA